jgi:hypothetical protein
MKSRHGAHAQLIYEVGRVEPEADGEIALERHYPP